jgi:hypothetical protein
MRISVMLSIALAAGLSVGVWTSQASAAARRDAAISRCIAKAHKRYPQRPNYDYGKTRTFVYEACMFAAGFSP